jgi:hypothetical protein
MNRDAMMKRKRLAEILALTSKWCKSIARITFTPLILEPYTRIFTIRGRIDIMMKMVSRKAEAKLGGKM